MDIHSKDQRKTTSTNWTFILLTICHYLFGIAAIFLAIGFATSHDSSSQKLAGLLSVICIVVFAVTQPDMKFKRMETGWRFLDEMLN